MKPNTKQTILLFTLMILPPFIILLSRYLFNANYLFSSIYKLIFLFPIIYAVYIERKTLKKSLTENFSFNTFKKNILLLTLIGITLAGIYLISFFIFQNYIDLQSIVSKLQETASINTTNIIFIGLYIIILNSLLEEYFWRGFLFNKLNKINPIIAYITTGIAFSFHHVMFYYNWFNITFFIIVTLGLTVYAIIMNYIFYKTKDLFSCWYVHIFADIVQIFIGLKIFGIL